jgi:hypothetical protein
VAQIIRVVPGSGRLATLSGLREHSHDLPIRLSPLTARWKRGIILCTNDPQPRGSHGNPYRTTKILSRARLRGGRLALAAPAQQRERVRR